MKKILVIDDDVASGRTLQLHFRSQGYDTAVASGVDEGLATAQQLQPHLLVMDIRMPGKSGLEGLPEFKQKFSDIRVIMITAFHDMESTIQAMQRGADDYIHKPIDIDELDAAVSKILAGNGSEKGMVHAGGGGAGDSDYAMVGSSRAMKEIYKTIGLVAQSPATVLITGESGTGKELVARAIHCAATGSSAPFVAVNCAAVVETLLESDMFGHEKGAFTGAVNRQPGKFALAEGGSIFLDEVGDLSPGVQAKLLRVIQEKEFVPLGGSQVKCTNARVIGATNADLLERVGQGKFREDLYYRFQVVNIHLPPLRERMEDLDQLVPALLGRINRTMHRKVPRLMGEVMDAFRAYTWPGNVRELENVLMKAVALSPGNTITLDLMPEQIAGGISAERAEEKPAAEQSLSDVEREHVARVLATTHWHRGRACEVLGISRPRLRRLISQYGLEAPAGGGAEPKSGMLVEEQE